MIKKLLAYSKKEAAAATSLSVRSIDYLIEKGQLRAVKVGGRVLIPSRELERLIEKGTTRQDGDRFFACVDEVRIHFFFRRIWAHS